MKKGIVYLVGAGPGDPDLLTIKGKRCLQRADVVVYDRLVAKAILKMVPKRVRLIDVGKEAGHHKVPQEAISELLVHEALQGNRVVRLKGGDPFVFGRGAEEINELVEAGIVFEVVPGISSAIAVPAYAGIALTCRGIASSFTVLTGHKSVSEDGFSMPNKYTGQEGTLVILMGLDNLSSIMDELLNKEWPSSTPVAVIESGTTREQNVVEGTISTIVNMVKERRLQAPAVIVVGEVVRLRETLSWYKPFKPVSSIGSLAGGQGLL